MLLYKNFIVFLQILKYNIIKKEGDLLGFHENLRFYRERAGYSLTSFSKKIGVSYNTYAGYEIRGREPKYQTLVKIADLLNVSLDDLLGRASKDEDEKLYKLISKILPSEPILLNEKFNVNRFLIELVDISKEDITFDLYNVEKNFFFKNNKDILITDKPFLTKEDIKIVTDKIKVDTISIKKNEFIKTLNTINDRANKTKQTEIQRFLLNLLCLFYGHNNIDKLRKDVSNAYSNLENMNALGEYKSYLENILYQYDDYSKVLKDDKNTQLLKRFSPK